MFKSTTARVVFALACLLPLAGCGSDQTPSETSPTAAPVVIPFGQGVTADGFEIALRSIKQRKQIGAAGIGPAAGTGETFVVAHYTVMNLGTEPVDYLNFPTVELIDGAGQVYAKDDEASTVAAALADANHSGKLNPKVMANQIYVWKVSKASFDPRVWHLKVSFDRGMNATIKKAARWPLETQFTTPALLNLK